MSLLDRPIRELAVPHGRVQRLDEIGPGASLTLGGGLDADLAGDGPTDLVGGLLDLSE